MSRKTAAAHAADLPAERAAACRPRADARIHHKHPASERDDGSAAATAAPRATPPAATYTTMCAQRTAESREQSTFVPIAQPKPAARLASTPKHRPDQSR